MMRRYAFLAGFIAGGMVAFLIFRSQPALDEPIIAIFHAYARPLPYTQYVETRTPVEERELSIVGTYYVDHERVQYDSVSTTTLSTKDGGILGTFTHENRVIDDDIYTRIRSLDIELRETLQSASAWKHFRGSIPAEFQDIASEFPINDSLALLRSGGKYLTLTQSRTDIVREGGTYGVYMFRLSDEALNVTSGTIGAIAERLGRSGTIAIIITPEATIDSMVLSNPPYYSTSTIHAVNMRSELSAPVTPEVVH